MSDQTINQSIVATLSGKKKWKSAQKREDRKIQRKSRSGTIQLFTRVTKK
jgi:hypothetical protein